MASAEQRIAGIRPGLRVCVTAGAGGIGRAIADGFIAHGARVVVSDVNEAALVDFSKAHPDHHAVAADAGSEAATRALFATVEERLGGLDLLVNNAGIAGPTAPVEEIATEAWQATVDINLNSHFFALRAAVPLLKQTENGSIIMISSVAGRLGYAYRLPYAATKWAIVGMAKSLSQELGSFGIRVNAILPGIVARRAGHCRDDELRAWHPGLWRLHARCPRSGDHGHRPGGHRRSATRGLLGRLSRWLIRYPAESRKTSRCGDRYRGRGRAPRGG
jgi:NAD(P)-dependent dehydrogenase (short-subunit alcohol dehydrogenase family)